jgi:hypothetical protein
MAHLVDPTPDTKDNNPGSLHSSLANVMASRDIHVGTPSRDADFPVEDSARIQFHGFDKLEHVKGVPVKSPTFTCAGYEWYVYLYPRGEKKSKDGMVGLYLGSVGSSKRVVDFDLFTKTKNGDIFHRGTSDVEFPRPNNQSWGWKDFVSRDEILDEANDVLSNGRLAIEVRIRPHKEYYCLDTKPRPPLGQNILDLYLGKDILDAYNDTADVAFKVKRSLIYAHKFILKAQEPDLAEIVDTYTKTKPLPIKDVDPEIFKTMLSHVYGMNIAATQWKDQAKQIVDASGKYGFTTLRAEAEAWYVKSLELTVETAIDELLYADGKHCSLLKKATMDFIVEHGEEILESESYEKLDESPQLRKEVMKAAFTSRKRQRDE